ATVPSASVWPMWWLGGQITGPAMTRQPMRAATGTRTAGTPAPTGTERSRYVRLLAAVLPCDEDFVQQDHGAGCDRDGHQRSGNPGQRTSGNYRDHGDGARYCHRAAHDARRNEVRLDLQVAEVADRINQGGLPAQGQGHQGYQHPGDDS